MNCILTFTIGEHPIEVAHDGSLSIDSIDNNLINFLKKSDQWGDIVAKIQEQMQSKVGTYKNVSVSQLLKNKGLLSNSNVQFIQDQYPSVIFPENVTANVLFLDNLRLGGKEHFGRNIKSDGTELFIIKNDEYHVEQFANFLNLREQIKHGFKFSEDSEEYKFLNSVRGNKTVNELIEDFMENKNSYRTKKAKIDGKEVLVYPKLDKILREILEVPTRKSYRDDFVNDINSFLEYKKVKGKWQVKLNIANLYNSVKIHHPEILTDEIKTIKDFKQYFGNKNMIYEGKEYSDGYELLFNKLITDDTFPYIYKKYDGINIHLETPSRKIGDRFDIAYSTIQAMEIIDNDYQGYKIYAQSVNDTTYYYPSRHYLTEDTITSRFTNIEDAKQYIIDKNKNQEIYENSYIEFNYDFDSEVHSPKFIEEGTIIEVKDYPIDKNEDVLYQSLFKSGNTRKDFERIIKGMNLPEGLENRIFNNIVTPEDMALFIHGINSKTTHDNINTIINQIKRSPKKAYYIESRESKSYKENGKTIKYYLYKVIPTEPNVVEQYKKTQKNIPTVRLIESIADSFKSKFNTDVIYLNKSEMQQQFPEVEEDIKAFIRDGKIYINTFAAKSSDLLHEYTHLLLGVLKADTESRSIYEQLLNMVNETPEGKRLFDELEWVYPGISVMDVREEVFAKLYGEYLSGRGSNIDDIFIQQEKYLKDKTQNIFDLNSETDLKTIYNKSLDSIFGRFSSDVATKLKENNGLDFSKTINARKKAKWLSEQISKDWDNETKQLTPKKIKEECYG